MNPTHGGYPDMHYKLFPYAATNPYRTEVNLVTGQEQPARFRDTVLARTRLQAREACLAMGLTHVVVYPHESI